MKPVSLKFIKWPIIFGFLIFLVVNSIWKSDNELPKVEAWLKSNSQVMEKTGFIKEISIKNFASIS